MVVRNSFLTAFLFLGIIVTMIFSISEAVTPMEALTKDNASPMVAIDLSSVDPVVFTNPAFSNDIKFILSSSRLGYEVYINTLEDPSKMNTEGFPQETLDWLHKFIPMPESI